MLAVGRLLAGVLQGPVRSLPNEGATGLTLLAPQSQGCQSQGQLALLDLPKDKEVSADVSKAATCPAAAGTQIQDVLVAASTEAQENLGNKRAPAGSVQAGQSSQQLTEHLDALRDGLRGEASEDSKGPCKRPSMKRPASTSKAKAASKPAGVMKRPGLNKKAAKETKKSAAAASKQGDRARLLASIPAALKERYRQGCGTCRYRAYCCNSCWRKRGFS